MTTIAWDGKTLAVDSQETADCMVVNINSIKLFKKVGDYDAVAFCGEINRMKDIIDWLKGREGVTKPSGDYSAIAIRKNTAYRITPESEAPIKLPSQYSDGSGHKVALSAMKFGATAKEALRVAIELDIYTGGKIQSYTVKSK